MTDTQIPAPIDVNQLNATLIAAQTDIEAQRTNLEQNLQTVIADRGFAHRNEIVDALTVAIRRLEDSANRIGVAISVVKVNAAQETNVSALASKDDSVAASTNTAAGTE